MLYVVYFQKEVSVCEDITAYTDSAALLKRYIEFVLANSDTNLKPIVCQFRTEDEVRTFMEETVGIVFGDNECCCVVEDLKLTVSQSSTRKNKYTLMTPYYEYMLRDRFEYDGGFSSYIASKILSRLEETLRRFYKYRSDSSIIAGIDRILCYLAAYDFIEDNFDDVLNGREDAEEIIEMSKALNLDIPNMVDTDHGYGVIDYYEYIDAFMESIFL